MSRTRFGIWAIAQGTLGILAVFGGILLDSKLLLFVSMLNFLLFGYNVKGWLGETK